MYAVEFRTKIKNGIIELPKRFKDSITDTVRVIIMKDEPCSKKPAKTNEEDIIAMLLTSPLEIKDFHPLTRDEIYAD